MLHAALGLLPSIGCNGSSSTIAEHGPPGALGDAGADASRAPPSCTDLAGGRPVDAACVLDVRGRVVDLSGNAISGVGVSLCGDVCFGGLTSADGGFDLPTRAWIALQSYVIDIDGRPNYADRILRAPTANAGIVVLPPLPTVRLPDDGPQLFTKTAIPVTVESGSLALSFTADSEMTYPLAGANPGPLDTAFRAVVVPSPLAQTAAGPDALLVYALAPFGAQSSRALALRGVLPAKLKPGDRVEFLGLDDTVVGDTRAAGTFSHVADGHVGPDGMTVSSDPGSSFVRLTWLAIRKAP